MLIENMLRLSFKHWDNFFLNNSEKKHGLQIVFFKPIFKKILNINNFILTNFKS